MSVKKEIPIDNIIQYDSGHNAGKQTIKKNHL